MNKEELKRRTKAAAIRVIKLAEKLPRNAAGFEIAKQIIRASISVASNYRAACRAKSTADFIYKLSIIIEEADETIFWLEMIEGASLLNEPIEINELKKEYDEFVAIFTASQKTVKAKQTIKNKN